MRAWAIEPWPGGKRANTIGLDQDYDLLVFRSRRKGGHHDQVKCWSFFLWHILRPGYFFLSQEKWSWYHSLLFLIPLLHIAGSCGAVLTYIPQAGGSEHMFDKRSCATEHTFVLGSCAKSKKKKNTSPLIISYFDPSSQVFFKNFF